MSNSFLSKFPTYQRLMKKLQSNHSKRDANEDGDFDIDGGSEYHSVALLSQESPTDTSNWDDRVSTTPDGRQHIKDLGASDSTTK